MYDNYTENNNSYVENGRVIDRRWEANKIMASTAKQVPLNDQFSVIGNKRVYATEQGERRANYRTAAAQPLKCEAEILSEQQRIRIEEDLRRLQQLQQQQSNNSNNSNNNNHNNSSSVKNCAMPLSVAITARSFDLDSMKKNDINRSVVAVKMAQTEALEEDDNDNDNENVSISSSVRNADMPLTWKWAASSLQKDKQKQQQQQKSKGLSPGYTSTFAETPESLNYNADYTTAQTIVNELKSDELSTGKEYSADDLSSLIRTKYPGINENIVQIATEMIVADAEFFTSRIEGSFPNFKMLLAARNPFQPSINQVQQQQQQQPQGNMKANETLPKNVQDLINQLSDSDKARVQQIAQSVANDILNKSQTAIDEVMLQQQIALQYNIDTSLANIVVQVLKSISPYSQKIIPSQQQQKNQQYQQQQQGQPSNNNAIINNSSNSSNSNNSNSNNNDHLGKQSFAGYTNMNQCLKSQTMDHGLSEQMALKTCTNMLNEHLKNKATISQQQQQQQQQTQQQQQQQKTANTNRFKNASWQELKSVILQSGH